MLIFKRIIAILVGWVCVYGSTHSASAAILPPPGESSALPDNLIDQVDIETGVYSLEEVRMAGGIIFTTSLNRFDGLGDGPPDIFDSTRSFPFRGDRPTLQTGMTAMLRTNGLDARSCLECHAIVSSTEMPPRHGIGGHGGINNSAMPGTRLLEVDDPDGNGVVDTTGRVINPPFLFGAGGIELLAKEMTRDLQVIKASVENQPQGTVAELITKGVRFGTITSAGIGNPAIVSSNNSLGIMGTWWCVPSDVKERIFPSVILTG